MEVALQNLAQVVDATSMEQIQIFVNVTDTFGQIYVAKDITSRNYGKNSNLERHS
jgi:hypothetical protein